MPKRLVVATLAVGMGVVAGSPVMARPPEVVSPVGLVELRCPMFSWAAVSGAAGYELVVYAVSEADEVGKEPLLSVRLPAGAAAWTPPGSSCLAAGGRYAWTLRVLGAEGTGAWSEPSLFEVAAGPSLGEVEAAIATLRRYLADSGRGGAGSGERVAEEPLEADRPAAPPRRSRTPRSEARVRSGEAGVLRPAAERDLKSATAASVPTLGTPSLTVDANVALGAASNLFKGGSVFLWDDTTGNTAMGRLALASATGTADHNTAVGREALRYTTEVASYFGSYNTAVGDGALRSNTIGYSNTASGESALRSNTTGSSNTSSGASALRSNTTGYWNTAIGVSALRSNTTGHTNTASGYSALDSNTTGSFNTAIGYRAGVNATTGSDNIFVGSGAFGVAGNDNTIRIGGAGFQNRTFIEGIRGIMTANADAIAALIDTAGQLGTASSSREVKQDIREIGDLSRRLLELRPVAFRYRQHVAIDPETPLQFGLLAEEVAEVFPELVVRDQEGQPETVKYHLLSALLLNELQRADRELEALRERLAAVERGLIPGRRPLP